MDFSVITIFLMGISFSFLLFLLGSGLSLTYGVMKVLNLAHGAYYLVGSFVGLSVYEGTGNFFLAILAGAAITGLIGIGMEQGFIRHLPGQLLDQVLLTVGFLYIFTNIVRWIWGPIPQIVEAPSLVAGSLQIGENSISVYHFVVIFIGILIAIGLWFFQQKTQFGAIIRAGTDNRQMVMGLGINFRLVCMWVFCLGTALAGIAAVIGLPLLGAYLESGMDILLYAVIVVIVGGLGSLQGALLGSFIIGMVHTFGKVLFPPLAFFMIYLIVVVILLVRPSGLLGEREPG